MAFAGNLFGALLVYVHTNLGLRTYCLFLGSIQVAYAHDLTSPGTYPFSGFWSFDFAIGGEKEGV